MMGKKKALISVYDKSGLEYLCSELVNLNVEIIATGSTALKIKSFGLPVVEVSEITKYPEILEGRVKTLHPVVHGGILSRDRKEDREELLKLKIDNIDYVICNLYPFEKVVALGAEHEQVIENIDIGGVTLLRAAAKNYERVTVVCDVSDYKNFINALRSSNTILTVPKQMRNEFALKAFTHTANYDNAISNYLRNYMTKVNNYNILLPKSQSIKLKYGVNPHQNSAFIYMKNGKSLPLTVLQGTPSYINLMDALNSWPLVKELSSSLNIESAASFKHVSPSGAAVGVPLTNDELIAFGLKKFKTLSPLACAYARARGADRMCSFGDWVALSHECDADTANILSSEVSDGVIAPNYSPEALEILSKKKGGNYCILRIDPDYEPTNDFIEHRDIYGITLCQQRNYLKITEDKIGKIVTRNKENESISKDVIRDIIVALTSLKYSQSNSVCLAKNGMVVGLGTGQQSRIHCTRIAGDKADNFWLRLHPKTLALKFNAAVKKPARANAIDAYVTGNFGDMNELYNLFSERPELLTAQEKTDWISKRNNVVMCSDAFFPFSDNVVRANMSGVSHIVAPKGSVMDDQVIKCAESLEISFLHIDYRLFHH